MVQEPARLGRRAEPAAVAEALRLRLRAAEGLGVSLTLRNLDSGVDHLRDAITDSALLALCAPENAALVQVTRTCEAQGLHAVAIGNECPMTNLPARSFNGNPATPPPGSKRARTPGAPPARCART
jgi:hypothetical protein